MKNYKNIREHYSRTSYTPPYASEAADDIDINLGVLDEECISRINAYLQQQTASYINPNNALNKLQRRLSTIGLVFTFPKERPYVRTESNISITSESFPISYMGGRTGVLDANYNIGTDDNIRWRTGYGLRLSVQYSLPSDGGLVAVLPRIEIVAGVTESLTTKSPKDQLKSAVRHYDRSFNKQLGKLAKNEMDKLAHERNSPHDVVKKAKSKFYDKARLTDQHPENGVHRKLANLETKVARKRIKAANAGREEYKRRKQQNENSTLKTRSDQLRDTKAHYDRVMKKLYSHIGRDELKKNKDEPNKNDIAYDAVSNIKNATYRNLHKAKVHPENDTHRKLSNLEKKIDSKEIKHRDASRDEWYRDNYVKSRKK